MFDLTIAISTWNRADVLDLVLAGLRELQIPHGLNWEVLVVNNNCTDHTEEVVARHQSQLPVRSVFEGIPGASAARNRALEDARADWVFCIDDDMLVEPDVVAEYWRAIQEVDADVVFLGGPIGGWFPEPPDPVMLEAIPTVRLGLGGRDVAESKPIRSPADGVPNGANFVVCRPRLGSVRFRQELGPHGGQKMFGEDRQFFLDLLAAGKPGRWVKSARVLHYVPPERLQLGALRQYFVNLGRSDIRLGGIPSGRRFCGAPGWIWKDVARYGWQTAWGRLTGNRFRFYEGFSRFCIRWGGLRECLSRRDDS